MVGYRLVFHLGDIIRIPSVIPAEAIDITQPDTLTGPYFAHNGILYRQTKVMPREARMATFSSDGASIELTLSPEEAARY